MRVDCARLGWSAARRARLSAAQRGQSMVEFAFCIPVFLLLLFGTFEVGMLYKTHAAYDQAAQQAVRIAASAGNAGNADAQMLTALQHTLASQDLTQIAAATVYDATVDGTQVPGSPQTGSVRTQNTAPQNGIGGAKSVGSLLRSSRFWPLSWRTS
jgi:Flp pilus assembly protein TadG